MQSDTQCERTCFSDSSSEIEQDFSVDGLIVIPLKKRMLEKRPKRKSFREIKAEKISDKIQEKIQRKTNWNANFQSLRFPSEERSSKIQEFFQNYIRLIEGNISDISNL